MAAWLRLWYDRGTIHRPAPRPARILSPWEALVGSLASASRAAELRRSRRALLKLTDGELRDIGVTREEAEREARRSPFLG